VLRRIFGPRKEEVTGCSRKLHNEELHKLYQLPNTIIMVRKDKVGRVYCTNREEEKEEKCIWDSDGKPRRKKTSRNAKT
jgi:hypothetical protein